MKLKCPACGAPIPASAINVQQMVAVCPECDNVFKFDAPFARQQRRKLKAPAQFKIVDEDPDRLDMAFKWSLRTEPPVGLFAIAFGLVVTLLMLLGMLSDGAPAAALLIPLVPASFLIYTVLTLVFNSTHYQADAETLKVYTEPLPFLRYGSKSIHVADIAHVSVERPAYAPFPEGKQGFYDVFVHTLDGDKVKVAAIVNYEHAYFIAQEIEAYVHALRDLPARIADDQFEMGQAPSVDDELPDDELPDDDSDDEPPDDEPPREIGHDAEPKVLRS